LNDLNKFDKIFSGAKCKTKFLFREKNLGCKYAVSGAIDWFFENVEQGIILEDDVLPDQSFFRFCQEMLERYKDDKRIMSVSGYNPLGKYNMGENYLFSKYFFCWGWATWRRAWKKNNLEMKNYFIKNKGLNFFERILFSKKLQDNLSGKISSWAIIFSHSHFENKGLSIVPQKNLIKNLGFSDISFTHTKENKWDNKFLNRKPHKLKFPLTHSKKVKSNKKFSRKYIIKEYKRIILKKLF